MSTVFISYNSIDRSIASRLTDDLRAAGHAVWFDQSNIAGNIPYWQEIQDGIETATHFMFLISPESIADGGGAMRELYHASGLKPVPVTVPVLVRPTPGKWPILISQGMYQFHDLVNHTYEEMLPRIKNAVAAQAALRAGTFPEDARAPARTNLSTGRFLIPILGIIVVAGVIAGFVFLKSSGGSVTPTSIATFVSTLQALVTTSTVAAPAIATQLSSVTPTSIPTTSVRTIMPSTVPTIATVPPAPKPIKIAFSRNGDIWVMDSDGANAHALYTNPNTDEAVPAWSYGGATIAFRSQIGGNSEVYAVDVDGSNLTRLTVSNNRDTMPDYSPNDKQIVYSTTQDKIADIVVMNADGSNAVYLTNKNNGSNYTPRWSPDGKHIVFSSNRSGNYEIWIMDSDGGNPTQITHNGAGNYVPAWSADGKYIAFQSDLNGRGTYDIYRLSMNGLIASTAVDLTNTPGYSEIDPAWSPNGLIAYVSDQSGTNKIYVMSKDFQPSTTYLAEGTEPAWSH